MMVNTRNTSNTPEGSVDSIQEMFTRMMDQFTGVNNKLTAHEQQFTALQSELASLRSGEGPSNRINGAHVGTRQNENQNRQFGRMSKMEFPRFNGDDVKGWIFRCRQFFCLDQVEDEMKVGIAAMHVYDKALVWHQQFIKRYGENSSWEVYEQQVLKRFG